ncbi:GDP-mannose pyrophosphatase NudK [Streptomyces lavendulae subsp. lavendulae]|uniref:GDP-mannose pyrophosphatase NudK n=1 Tax=Streptomyces lavendulae subsp. lavendulae TaxID=58340 RepID=A0A2K8P602_STRLA|nr:GDP-mannose pyrophosphatase NudK [Streptomyces lavendulae subsp. lavendulae]
MRPAPAPPRRRPPPQGGTKPVTERLHFYAARYTPAGRTGSGGGLEEDGEDIDILERPFTDALAMIRDGRIADGKTIMLLQRTALHGPFAATAGAH